MSDNSNLSSFMDCNKLLARIYLKSGNVISISDNFNEIDLQKTLDYFEAVIDKFKQAITKTTDSPCGYFRYGGIIIHMSRVEAIEISENLYNECNILSSNKTKDPAYLSYNTDMFNKVKVKSVCYIKDKLPKTVADYTNNVIKIEN